MIGDRDFAQAEALIHALNNVRAEMVSRMTRLEKHNAQRGAAALRRDINEAEAHISRLQSRYLGREIPAPAPRVQANRRTS
ncbi:hypothetical protein [Mycobacterium sp.]|uniref:hypothetical protein n=1 Tax=Mycobacterium sp. TaxID=1785 RepID=UPI003D0BD30F